MFKSVMILSQKKVYVKSKVENDGENLRKFYIKRFARELPLFFRR